MTNHVATSTVTHQRKRSGQSLCTHSFQPSVFQASPRESSSCFPLQMKRSSGFTVPHTEAPGQQNWAPAEQALFLLGQLQGVPKAQQQPPTKATVSSREDLKQGYPICDPGSSRRTQCTATSGRARGSSNSFQGCITRQLLEPFPPHCPPRSPAPSGGGRASRFSASLQGRRLKLTEGKGWPKAALCGQRRCRSLWLLGGPPQQPHAPQHHARLPSFCRGQQRGALQPAQQHCQGLRSVAQRPHPCSACPVIQPSPRLPTHLLFLVSLISTQLLFSQ